mmetsp:Transcript_82310/g.233134  ORF Transcript_82310/g.233134 Transcript_82310/m.233134 type:complete len:281 (+) Transcript_82310:609-1451(+)
MPCAPQAPASARGSVSRLLRLLVCARPIRSRIRAALSTTCIPAARSPGASCTAARSPAAPRAVFTRCRAAGFWGVVGRFAGCACCDWDLGAPSPSAAASRARPVRSHPGDRARAKRFPILPVVAAMLLSAPATLFTLRPSARTEMEGVGGGVCCPARAGPVQDGNLPRAEAGAASAVGVGLDGAAGRDWARSKFARMRAARSPRCRGGSLAPAGGCTRGVLGGGMEVAGVIDPLRGAGACLTGFTSPAQSPDWAARNRYWSRSTRCLVMVFAPSRAGRTQ